jgi:preprotein translocase subunit SecA
MNPTLDAISHSQKFSAWRALASQLNPPKIPSGLDILWAGAEGRIARFYPRRSWCLAKAKRIERLAGAYESLSDADLRQRADKFRHMFRLGKDRPADRYSAYAMVGEVTFRHLGFRPHGVQYAAALAMDSGWLAELATGEGKTLVATLTATVAGWRGRGCHVVTVNDYLAKRDCQWMRPIYEFCGLSVGFIENDSTPEQRRDAYAADVTFGANKQIVADFLRDRLALGRHPSLENILLHDLGRHDHQRVASKMVQRGLACAILDEADSVLIDDAVTPLLISSISPNGQLSQTYKEAAGLADQLQLDIDYQTNPKWREVELTAVGQRKLEELCEAMGGVWLRRRRRQELMTHALAAIHFFNKDHEYVVQEGKIVLVDESTGRLMPDHAWRNEMQEAVEAKEGLEIQPPKQTLAGISYQRFFRLYQHLSGMTGTAWECGAELWQTYRLPVVRIPTHKPCRRIQKASRLWSSTERKWQSVTKEVQKIHATGRPVLIGTRSIDASEAVSRYLTEAGFEHQVLNAQRHEQEAEIIKEAGQAGRITVATNMAGRGTDIQLGPGIADKGGLYVIATEFHESRRVDRQLFGRTGRQGDAGGAIAMACLEDELFKRHGSRASRWLLRLLAAGDGGASGWMTQSAINSIQARSQRKARRNRRQVLRGDDWLDEHLAFAHRAI